MPIAGQTMGQGKMMEQKDMMVSYPDNSSMIQSSMTTQHANLSNINIDCARFWLDKAIKLHEVHLNDSKTATNESQMEMMDQMMQAYECIKGENVTMKMANMTGSHVSGKSE